MAIQTDVVIIGAGPVGLFQVFELGLQGLNAIIIDALPDPGGQCIELYPDKPIYDIPAVPMCTGRELIDKLMDQIAPFEAPLHLDQTVDGIDAYEASQLFYRVRNPEAHADKHIVILGGGDSAIDWALALADKAASLTLVNRTERFRAAEASVEKLMALRDAGKVSVLFGAVKAYAEQEGKLSSVHCVLRDEEKSEVDLPLDDLLVFFGLSPKLGPVEEWGMDLEKNLVSVDCETFATSVPGIYAVGDINTYPGKKKLILSGFHETAVAAHAIKHQFEPDKKQYTQYTTTSSVLQKRLGVDDV